MHAKKLPQPSLQQLILISLQFFRQVKQQSFRLFPTQAGVGNRFAVDAIMHALSTVLDIAFNHQALDDSVDISIQLAGMHNILGNADLLQIFFAGIGVVGIHNNRRVLQLTLRIHINNDFQHLIMVVGETVADGVYITTQNGMRQRVALGAYLPATEQKFLLC